MSAPSSSSSSSASSPWGSLRQKLRYNLVNPVALGYLAIVLAVCAWVAVDAISNANSGDASLAGIWITVVTAPTSFFISTPITLLGPILPPALAFVDVVLYLMTIPVSALIQAFALGVVYRWFTNRNPRANTSAA
ncbi:SCO4225 family membrane protein [Streptomyces paludis]|uniref:Uncharacterized protein n=1 Tax=Streptomyces paludis TaxID=2282738 RepID=A0A345HRH9_9ACTN|nr:hypothetical protein [Streptomyces paludis]AXG79303.1 hypothetical protein DVK44_18415 [Streptomyces paludis]